MASFYYFIDYCPQCGGGYKVCRTGDNYLYSKDMNWHNADPGQTWSFNNYSEAYGFAQRQPDRVGTVLTSSRAAKRRDRDNLNAVVKFPITERRGRELSKNEQLRLARAEAKAEAFNAAVYFVKTGYSRKNAADILTNLQKEWEAEAQEMRNKNYVA